jgi:hypothetical protein
MDVTVHAYAPKILEIEDEAGLPLNLPEEPNGDTLETGMTIGAAEDA